MTDDEFRMVSLSREQRDWLDQVFAMGWGRYATPIVTAWDAAPESAWDEIAEEFKRHRCHDGNCFAESVLMRLGALPAGNPSSPFGI